MYIQHCNHRCSPSLFRVANGGPDAAHVWQGCCGFWEPGRKGRKLGFTTPMRQKDVVMMSPLAGVVQKPCPHNTGDILLKITYNRFSLAYVIGLYNIRFYCVKIGWKLIRACRFLVVKPSSDSREHICEWNFCQRMKFKCLSDLTTSLVKILNHWNMAKMSCNNIFSSITGHFISTFHHSDVLLFTFSTFKFKNYTVPQKTQRSKFLL